MAKRKWRRHSKILKTLPFEDLGYAKVDHHRAMRHGMPEVIFGRVKQRNKWRALRRLCWRSHENLLLTRATPEMAESVRQLAPEAEYFPAPAWLSAFGATAPFAARARLRHLCAGTSDLPCIQEAQLTAEVMGNDVDLIADVGVAGIHRLLNQRERLADARVAIVRAGMEGALPSVVGGLVGCPVIAVPTSIGYGASFNGLAALLGMLNSCASNVTVVNIDNGFGAGYVASLINRL